MGKLSVVVIARNEEARLGRVLESVLAATSKLTAEVILVDSASTDATVAVAARYPVRLLGLEAGWFLSPAAGRHVGLAAATGEFVFFLDGDSELQPGFLKAALPLLRAEPEVAALFGKRRELTQLAGGRQVVVEADAYHISGRRFWRPGERIGGSGLYRARALREVGGFNPWISSFEEAELCTRLFDAGHRLVFIPEPMISHLDHQRPSVRELRRRWRQNLLLGRGQVLRLHPFRLAFYEGLGRTLGMLGCLSLLPLLSGAALAAGDPRLALAWPALMGALYAGFALHARSLSKPAFYFLMWMVSAAKLVQGFSRRPRDPADYPLPWVHEQHLQGGAQGETQGESDERPADNNRLLEGRQARLC